jgi:hypothetical protein
MKRNLYLTLIPRFVETSLLLSEKQANSHVISYNRVVLLHGPPGTGKTSLCQVGWHLREFFRKEYETSFYFADVDVVPVFPSVL